MGRLIKPSHVFLFAGISGWLALRFRQSVEIQKETGFDEKGHALLAIPLTGWP
jgi:hypothetical protein